MDLKKEGKINDLLHIIYFDEAKQSDIDLAKEVGVTLHIYENCIKEGSTLNVKFDDVHHDSIYTLSYTSGTTGLPKGTMLTHRNFVSNIEGLHRFDGVFKFYNDDVYISYLPLAHVFERMLMLACMANHVQYGFYQGDVFKLKDDLAVLKPTIMVSVPRLFTRFYDVMQSKIKELTGMKRRICEWGI